MENINGIGSGQTLWEEVLDFISREGSIDGALAERLLALSLGRGADAEPRHEAAACRPTGLCEDAEEWDFVDPLAGSTGMREPLSELGGGISQADIVRHMIAECQDEPELAERLRSFMDKYL